MFYIYSSTVIFPRYNSKLFKVLPMHRKMKMHESNNTQYLEAETQNFMFTLTWQQLLQLEWDRCSRQAY